MVFGVFSSPFLLNATIKHNMNGYKEVDLQFVEKLERSIYVVNVTVGACSKHETFQLYEKAKCWLVEGAFNLCTLRINCPELQRPIDLQECQGADVVPSDQKNTTADDESYVRNTLVTAMSIQVVRRCLGSSGIVHLISYPLTFIGVVSRFYDPLGIMSPFTVLFKLLFQKPASIR